MRACVRVLCVCFCACVCVCVCVRSRTFLFHFLTHSRSNKFVSNKVLLWATNCCLDSEKETGVDGMQVH